MQWPIQSPDLNPAEDQTEGKMSQEQAGAAERCSRGLAERHQG